VEYVEGEGEVERGGEKRRQDERKGENKNQMKGEKT
jgi:hypothetical protein